MLPTTTAKRAQANWHGRLSGRLWHAFFVVTALALTVWPVVNVLSVITSTGADNLCNDYLAYTGIIDQIFSGTYDWRNYLHDTFYRTHSVAIPVLLHILDAWLFQWSVYSELYLGVALAVARMLLCHQILTQRLTRPLRWVMLPVLSALVFSPSQISIFVYGDGALTIGLSLFGFALGLWGLTCCRRSQVTALTLMVAGGIIASYSWGNGPISWLIFLAALPALGYRKPWHYALWAVGISAAVAPYLLNLVVERLASHKPGYPGTSPLSLFNWKFIVNALGWPFANGIGGQTERLPEARFMGTAGLLLAASGLAAYLSMKPKSLRLWAPPFLFISCSCLSIWQISIFRNLIASWYTAVAMPFWIGIVALAAMVYDRIATEESGGATALTVTMVRKVWAVAALAFVAWAFSRSNLTYEDKTDLLFARSPASASALRHYRTAPTYCEGYLFQWGVGNPGLLEHLAAPLERHGLSTFARHQRWALQGDFLLHSVKVIKPEGRGEALWTPSVGAADRLPFYHFKHLNLMLRSPAAVTWSVEIPAQADSVEFLSAARAATSANIAQSDRAGLAEIFIKTEGEPDKVIASIDLATHHRQWHPVHFSLSGCRGKTVTLGLASSGAIGSSVLFRHPEIVVRLSGPVPVPPGSTTSPSNTDLSPHMVQDTQDDVAFDLDPRLWKPADPEREATGKDELVWRPGSTPQACYRGPLRVELGRYSHFCITLAVPQSIRPRAVTVEFKLLGEADPVKFQIPLLPDGRPHRYTYDLKLLELPAGATLTGLTIRPVPGGAARSKDEARVYNLRLIAAKAQ